MSKHQKHVRRQRRKTDASRRKNARSRGLLRHPLSSPLRGSHIRHAAAALAAAASIAAGTAAYADQVCFENPAHGEEGHFHWPHPGLPDGYLDITLPAVSQPEGYAGYYSTSTLSQVSYGGLSRWASGSYQAGSERVLTPYHNYG